MNLTPISAVCRNPLMGIRAEDRIAVRLGTRIRDIEPKSNGGLIVCRFNGEWLLREHWDEVLQAGDYLEWHDYPQGREGFRTFLSIALVAATLFTGGLTAAGYGWIVPSLVAANVGYNILVPPRTPDLSQIQGPGSVYGTSLAGNTARLDQPIWKICGRVKITPPFACQPYVEFRASDPLNPTVDTDQYYYALFALGIGNHTVEKAMIGKTSIAHFKDVLVADYLAPGVQPSTVLANVVTSDEVAAALELLESKYVGGYAASRPGDLVTAIGIDIAASQGLGVGTAPLTVEWQVEAREIDQYGRPIGDWVAIGSESRTANTNTPQRWSNKYTLTTPIRPEVRVVRTNLKNTDGDARDGIQWIGMRAYLEREAPLNADTAHYEVVMRASDQLSSFSQRDFSLILRALVRTWDPDTGWGVEVFTRNPMWWLADLWTNPIWGEGFPDARIDLQGLFDVAQILDARQDHFDYALTSARDSWEVAQLIAHSGRCRAFRKGGVYTLARDELVDVPVTAFTSRNTQPKSMIVHADLPRREQPDGVVVEYQSNVIWDTVTEECPCYGFSATSPASPFFDTDLPEMSNPIYIALDGVTGSFHALREGIYQAASMSFRTTTVSAKVEMEGMIVCFLDPVRWQPQIRGYGQTGDVAFWDVGTLVMGLTEPADFSGDPPYLTLQRDDGTLTDPVAVLPGPTVYDVILPAAPDFVLVLDDGLRERPKFVLGPLLTSDELVKISSITDGGKAEGGAQLFDVEALIDDDRVHTVDNFLLPGPGEIQDPIDSGDDFSDEEGGGTFVHPRLEDHLFFAHITPETVEYELGNDGILRELAPTPTSFAHEWLAFAVEPAEIALFEVRFTAIGATHPAALLGTFDTWLALSTSRSFGYDGMVLVGLGVTTASVSILAEVRRIGTTIVQASGDFDIAYSPAEESGGP